MDPEKSPKEERKIFRPVTADLIQSPASEACIRNNTGHDTIEVPNMEDQDSSTVSAAQAVPLPSVAPVLSTPDTHIFEDPTPVIDHSQRPRPTDEQLLITYEVERTVREIREKRWQRVALQFPDRMLADAPRVVRELQRGLRAARQTRSAKKLEEKTHTEKAQEEISEAMNSTKLEDDMESEEQLFILADTSYGACCVDEVAAEHVNADGVVHYGRSCLSPTARLPVIYVFTTAQLDMDAAVDSFSGAYPDKHLRVVLMADTPFSTHIPELHRRIKERGYENVFATETVHDPSALLPNRSLPQQVQDTPDALKEYRLFHLGEPPEALLLTLSSRVEQIHIYSEDDQSPKCVPASSNMALRRRYALLTSLTTCSIFGILINTLSVQNYLHVVERVRKQIADAGKKSYTFVVGKVNPAKVANFSEVGGWVVIGCWESSLIDSKEFWRPLITPFELSLTLQSDAERVWTGEWSSDFSSVLERDMNSHAPDSSNAPAVADADISGGDSEDESEPPEFDLRTGRYISHTRPMGRAKTSSRQMQSSDNTGSGTSQPASASALIQRSRGDLVQIGGTASPGAEFLTAQRTWQGLGSDFAGEAGSGAGGGDLQGAVVEEGRRGLARGYVVGDDRTTR